MSDEDYYGDCFACKEKVIGEGSGCSAMNNIYHLDCFTCVKCRSSLKGKQFYVLEGEPHCEADYLDTLEKCSVCNKPIVDRILRATGKTFHPGCFTCVVCNKVLDNVPFTVADDRVHCIEDYHKKFAPRCSVCKDPIIPEPGKQETVRVVALEKSFHVECYKCEDCGITLSSDAKGQGCYPIDDHILCKECNKKRAAES